MPSQNFVQVDPIVLIKGQQIVLKWQKSWDSTEDRGCDLIQINVRRTQLSCDLQFSPTGLVANISCMSRLEKLQQLLQDDPADPFLHYAIGTELLTSGETESGLEKLRETIQQFPDYVASYFRLGQAYAENDRPQEARQVVTTGIEVGLSLIHI